MSKKLVPINFQVPHILQTDHIKLRMLTIHDAVKDYEAVMSSIEYLQNTKPFGPKNNWPQREMTLEQNLIDLGWHQKEFQRKTSFAYTVVDLKEERCLGCVYIFASSKEDYDVEIFMWMRQSDADLDLHLYNSVKNWIRKDWPFQNPVYPGRNINWDTWERSK